MKHLLILVSAACLLAGCAAGPNYKRPAVNTPVEFRGATLTGPKSFADLPWWKIFRDENLHNLIQTALANNLDLRVAIARVDQSRELAAQARSQFLPQINYQGAVSRGQDEFLGSLKPTVDRFGKQQLGNIANAVTASLNAAWEVDLWGRVRRLNESAQAQFLASQENQHAIRLGLVAEVAQAYFELLELDLQHEIAQHTADSFAHSLKIFDQQLRGGVASRLEIARAEAAQASVAAAIPETERLIALKENQINLLLGHSPGPVRRSDGLLQQAMPPEIPAGLPSALLERRPDIRASEQLLRSANAQVGVTVAEFFPKIGLTALAGKVSPELSTFTLGAANGWSLAANGAGPIFHGGALVAQHRGAQAAWREAKANYEQSVLNALMEVSNVLVSREKFDAIRAHQARAVQSYVEAVRVSMQRYEAGKAAYYEVLEAQQQLFPAENTLAQTELNQVLAVVQLYRALGGGWKLGDQEWSDQKPPQTPVQAPVKR